MKTGTRNVDRRCVTRTAALLMTLTIVGCISRSMRIQQKGLTCVDAQRVAAAAVRRLSYTINTVTRPTPGTPGMITASRDSGGSTQSLVVQVFCTAMGAEIEATTDQEGLAAITFPSEFQRSFEAAAAVKAPPRAAAETGLDVLVTPERDGGTLGVSPGDAFLVVSVRITNHTPRTYGFRVDDLVLQTSDGARATHLKVADLTAHFDATDAETLRQKVLRDRDLAPNDTLTGFLYFPFKSYARARVVLTDRSSDEPEGFSIEF